MARVIMASVIYVKCYLWQMYCGKCDIDKSIMATETEPFILCNANDEKTTKIFL